MTSQARRRLWIYQAKQAGQRQSTAHAQSPAEPHAAAAQQHTHTLTDQRTGHGQQCETKYAAPSSSEATPVDIYPVPSA